MNSGRRIIAGLMLLVSAIGLILSLAGGIGVWVVKEPVVVKATHVFGRIDSALDTADSSLDQVKISLARAGERLQSVREEQQKLAQEPGKGNAVGRFIGRTVQRQVAPEIGNAHQKLHTVAEAAVVVNAVLEDLGNLPFLSTTGLDIDQLNAMNTRLADVGPAAWELSRLLGEPPQPGTDAAGEQLSRTAQTVDSLHGLVGEYQSRVTQVRQRTNEVKSRALGWITPGVVLISLVCFWIAFSQCCVLSRAWSRLTKSGTEPTESP